MLLALLPQTLLPVHLEAALLQLLLQLDHLLQVAERLLALRGLRLLRPGAQVLEHLLQLGQHLAGSVARAAAHQLAGPVEHLLQVAPVDRLAVLLLHGLGRHLLALLHRLAGELLQELVHRLLQLLHQPLELGVLRTLLHGLLQLLLQVAQLALGHRERAVLDEQRELPQQIDHRAPARGIALVHRQPCRRDPQGQWHRRRQLLGRRRVAQRRQAARHLVAVFGRRHELAPLLDDRARQRMAELARRQRDLQRPALAALADRVDGLEPQRGRQAGERVRSQVLDRCRWRPWAAGCPA